MIESQTLLTIQQASRRTGLSVHTLRYYERIEVLTPAARNASGHRRYSEADIDRITFLNNMRKTGMPLEEIKYYESLLGRGDLGIAERIAILQEHREKIAEQVNILNDMLATIDYKLDVLKKRSK